MKNKNAKINAKIRDSILCFIVSALLYGLCVFLLFVAESLVLNLLVVGTIFLIVGIVFLIKGIRYKNKNSEETDKDENTDKEN